jgi:transglutaminase-like putative cysteine protease
MFSLRPTFVAFAVFTILVRPAYAAEPKGKDPLTLEQAIEQAKKQQDDAANSLHAEWPKLAMLEARSGAGPDTVRQRKKVAELLKAEFQKDCDYKRLLNLQARSPAPDDGKMAETNSLEQWLALAKKHDFAPFSSGSPPLPTYDYSAVKKRVLEVSKGWEPTESGPTHSIPELAQFLVKGAKNDREKAWALSYWVAHNLAYDYDAFKLMPKEILRIQQPEEVFKLRAALCEGHARLLQSLGQSCGLEMKYVSGHFRSPGEVREAFRKYSETAQNGVAYVTHGWTAVKLDEHWYMIDPTFADINEKHDGQFPKEKKDPHAWHFLLPPEWTIYSHYPKLPEDQMLKTAASRQEVDELPLLSPPYFHNGLKLEAPFAPVIKAEDSATVILHVPLKSEVRAELDEVDISQNKKVRLPHKYCLAQRIDEQVRIRVVAPKAGTYFLTIFAGAADPLILAVAYHLEFTGKNEKETGFPAMTREYTDRKTNVFSPMADTLEAGKVSYFAVRAPGAKQVRVVTADGKQYPLFAQDDLHMGCLILPPGDVNVGAIYPEKPTAVVGLAQYQAKKDK